MMVNGSTLIAIQQSFNALFQRSLMETTPLWPLLAMEITSTHLAEIHQWLGRVPQMREWIDVKVINPLLGFQFIITNKDYESTIAVDRTHIEVDMLGMYPPRIEEMSVRAAMHPDKLLSTARSAGETTKCYDEQFFYDTDHAEGSSGAQSNELTGSGVALADLTTDFYAARAALMNFKDDQGEPFIEPGVLMAATAPQFLVTTPTALWGLFDQLSKADVIAQTTNTLKQNFRLAVDSRLTDANDWYLDYVGGIVKPFIKQTRKNPVFVSLTDPNSSERVFMQKQFLYGVESAGAVDYALWQYSVKTKNT